MAAISAAGHHSVDTCRWLVPCVGNFSRERAFPVQREVIAVTLELVTVPDETQEMESKVRDLADRPILRAAIAANADVLLTGDRDFLESGIQHPAIVTPAEFLQG